MEDKSTSLFSNGMHRGFLLRSKCYSACIVRCLYYHHAQVWHSTLRIRSLLSRAIRLVFASYRWHSYLMYIPVLDLGAFFYEIPSLSSSFFVLKWWYSRVRCICLQGKKCKLNFPFYPARMFSLLMCTLSKFFLFPIVVACNRISLVPRACTITTCKRGEVKLQCVCFGRPFRNMMCCRLLYVCRTVVNKERGHRSRQGWPRPPA